MDKKFNQIILDHIPASIIIINKDGYITSANKYYQHFAKNKDYKNHNVFKSDFFIREKLISEYRKLFKKGTPIKRKGCYEKNQQGKDKYFSLLALPYKDQRGKVLGVISIGLDSTETILAEKKLIELNKNLERIVQDRTRKLNKTNEKMNQVLETRSNFMADVSHEIRNPLAIIQLELEILAQTKTISQKNFHEPIAQIFSEIKRLTNLLTDLSLLANSDSQRQKLSQKKIDLNPLIRTVVKSLKIQAESRQIKINYSPFPKKLEITANPEMMEKLFSNLIRNAIKYNKDSGWINIFVEKKAKEVMFKIEDSGMGIPKKEINHIFDRFYRSKNIRARKMGGSGLGLSICKLITDMHKGTISVQSVINKGTVFVVRLPLNSKKLV